MNLLNRIRWANVALVAASLLLVGTAARTVTAGPPPTEPTASRDYSDPGWVRPAEAPRPARVEGPRRPGRKRRVEPRRRVERKRPAKRSGRPTRRPQCQTTCQPPTVPRPAPAQPAYYPPPPASEFGFELP
jgi:hypothetical protein